MNRHRQAMRLIVAAACGLAGLNSGIRPRLAIADGPRETEVAVVLARNCLECHNASDRKGGLDLTRREQALAGGDSGQVLEPGNLDSLLMKRIDSGEMPPKGRDKLSADDRQLLRDWIKDGAIWAADPIDPIDPFLYTSTRRAGRLFVAGLVRVPICRRHPTEVSRLPLQGRVTRSTTSSGIN